jgi:ribose 5-phosphate isomerase A
MSIEKLNAAKAALNHIKDGMTVGLGTGTTAKEFIKLLADKIKNGLSIKCVATSLDTERFARELGIEILDFNSVDSVDVAVDGADVATKTALLKGGGGALAREKIVDYAANKFIVIVDETKIKKQLDGVVVVEVLPFAYRSVLNALKKYSKNPKLRLDERGNLKISDNGNFLIDCPMLVKNPKKIERELKTIPGVVENGIFTKFDMVVIGTEKGHYIL